MNLVTLPLATPAQLPPYVASRTLMAFAGLFSSAVTLATGEQRIMKATHPSDTIFRKFGSVMLFELGVVMQIGPYMLQLRSMTARDFSLTRFSAYACRKLSGIHLKCG